MNGIVYKRHATIIGNAIAGTVGERIRTTPTWDERPLYSYERGAVPAEPMPDVPTACARCWPAECACPKEAA